ncbi:craniofacial development protein 1-like isoform X2 [Varroa jacobsoni]|uniref:Craniofacial development protein 1 n=1 Tax=Varroa destructor TaxID=109461 RepID=A0A7M7JZA7_VARDE|nr:craniofacial development protein 1-like isoform X2 [Varroa destructor]XP_022692361.1 craniofacial development protein 1-like isoform X2 [Varroa jacobsoni]
MDKLAGDLMNDSDSDDQDYVPSGAESEEDDDAPADNSEIPDEDEAEKQKTDALWADFMADVEPLSKKARVEDKDTKSLDPNNEAVDINDSKNGAGVNLKRDSSASSEIKESAKDSGGNHSKTADSTDDSVGTSGTSNKIKVTQVFDFAGQKIEVEKEVDKNSKEAKQILAEQSKKSDEKKLLVRPKVGGGLSTIVSGLLNKKNKMSIFQKTQLDWDNFTKEKNIKEELANYNKGKDGYLEKVAFLDRTDLRQFELEKAMRDRQRAARGGNM